MTSRAVGRSISHAEVLNVGPHGIWILVNEVEYCLPYDEFPWFKKGTIEQLMNLEFLHGMHLRWPDLDVDLEIETLKNVEKYPLKYA